MFVPEENDSGFRNPQLTSTNYSLGGIWDDGFNNAVLANNLIISGVFDINIDKNFWDIPTDPNEFYYLCDYSKISTEGKIAAGVFTAGFGLSVFGPIVVRGTESFFGIFIIYRRKNANDSKFTKKIK